MAVWAWGTTLSACPCSRSIGGSFASTYLIGSAWRALSGQLGIAHPRSCASGASGLLWSIQPPWSCCASRMKSVGPKKSTPAWTALDTPVVPSWPSSAATPPVSAPIAATHPPDESPIVAKRSGSIRYWAALARRYRIAALTSCTCAGNFACELDLTLTPATAIPRGLSCWAIAFAPDLPSSDVHAEPVDHTTSGQGPAPSGTYRSRRCPRVPGGSAGA